MIPQSARLIASARVPTKIRLTAQVASRLRPQVVASLSAGLQAVRNLLPDSRPVWVKGNAEMMNRAVRNLAENAIKHAPPGTMVEFVVEENGTVRVRDRGRGISDEERELI
jgi:signal transduction histidine kinase